MSSVHWQARDDKRRSSLLGVLRGRRDKGKQRASVDLADVHEQEHDDDDGRLHSILPELGEGDGESTLRRRPPALDLDEKQAARDEAAAKLCGLIPPTPLQPVPLFPCAQSALAAHTQLSGPLLKHQPPTALARLVGSKAWKPRHGVLCTYALKTCTCARPHRSSGVSTCDAPTRTLACLHIFATPTPDALELARLIVTEDSVVFVVEPTFAADDSRRGPRDLGDRKWVIQVQGINGAPPPPSTGRPTKRVLGRRRESASAATASLKSGVSGRPRTVASFGVSQTPSNGPGLGSSLNLALEDENQVHTVWFLQCPDADARQRWTSCIKRAVLLQRAERAGIGGTVHFTSPRDPLPSGDLDVVLALRAHAQSAHIAQLRASTSPPHPAPPQPILSQPVTPVTATFGPGLTSSFVPVFSPTSTTFSPTSTTFSPASDHSHVDTHSLAFTRSQTPTYAPSVHTTHTTQTQPLPGRSRSRSSTVTNSAPVQALRGFFNLGSGGGSRPPSRSASVAGGSTKNNLGASASKKSRNRAASSSAAGVPPPHPYAVPTQQTVIEGQSPAPTSISFASALDHSDPMPQPYPYPYPNTHPYGPVLLGTPISAGLGSMDLGERDRERERERERDDIANGVLGLNFGYVPNSAGLPSLGVNGLPAISGKKGTSLPPPPRARRAGSVSHVLPGRVLEENPSEDGSRRPSLVPMMSLSFGQVVDGTSPGTTESPDAETDEGEADEESASCQQDEDDERDDGVLSQRESAPSHREPRVLPPQLAPPSVPLPLPPGSWPNASESSVSVYSVQSSSTGPGARNGLGGSFDTRNGSTMDRSRLSFGDGPRPHVDASWSRSRSRVSLEAPRESPGASRAHSRVSLALAKGMLADHPEGDGWDDVEGAGTGSYQESSTWASVRESPSRPTAPRESPTRSNARETSPVTFTRRSATDSVPSSPSSQMERESFGSAFLSRGGGEYVDHPFASQGRKAHRRAGSYGGPTLFTIADGSPLNRSKSQRSKGELPPAAPPPSVPLPPVPPLNLPPPPTPAPTGPLPAAPVHSRPATPVSRPRTPSRPGTASSQVSGLVAPQPKSSLLRTRLRMLSAPSPAPQTELPEPPRDLGALAECDLIQPISKVPISLLVRDRDRDKDRDDSSIRRILNEQNIRREPTPSLPPPPRIRMVRQHSHSASSDLGGSEGRRSDDSTTGPKGGAGARDSAVHLENRGSD
ncbi:hypothetical protein RhiJN_14554 [Ceratobasidium sp. AG-Ba]|nr:hypothetical protein RhiJN_14554 [Ceratobasidium sp. AG-Ba]